MKQLLLTLFLIAASVVASACATHVAYVQMPPPAPRVERYGYAPGPGYAWVDGYWRWSAPRYVWAPGYWARPPRRHSAWVGGRWMGSPRGYYYRRGYWR